MGREIIEASLFESPNVIGHQVNCMGAMKRGLAGQFKLRYPKVFIKYKSLCTENRDHPQRLLGMVQPVTVGDRRILNLFGQLRYGTGLQTDYDALRLIACKLQERAITVDLPWRIGCGLGGGDWEIVQKIFEPVAGRWFRWGKG